MLRHVPVSKHTRMEILSRYLSSCVIQKKLPGLEKLLTIWFLEICSVRILWVFAFLAICSQHCEFCHASKIASLFVCWNKGSAFGLELIQRQFVGNLCLAPTWQTSKWGLSKIILSDHTIWRLSKIYEAFTQHVGRDLLLLDLEVISLFAFNNVIDIVSVASGQK